MNFLGRLGITLVVCLWYLGVWKFLRHFTLDDPLKWDSFSFWWPTLSAVAITPISMLAVGLLLSGICWLFGFNMDDKEKSDDS